MRADEPMTSVQMYAMLEDGTLLNYINQLRYKLLIANARYFWMRAGKMEMADQAKYSIPNFIKRVNKCECIGNAHEARAKRIKDGM